MMNQTQAGPAGEAPEHAHDGHAHGCQGQPHHHDPAAVKIALANAEQACGRAGLRLTPIRRRVLEMLHEAGRPLGAYDVAATLGAEGGKLVAPVTVYRALDFLMAQGFVHRLESRNAFVACPHGHEDGDPAVFLICETCGGVDEAPSATVRRALDSVVREAGFAPRARVIEIAGTCGHCRAA